jgi:hypothetical protein
MMNDQADTDRTAALLRAALNSAADVMVVRDAPAPQQLRRTDPAPRGWGRWAPLAAAAAVAVVAGGTVIGAHLAGGQTGTGASTHPTEAGPALTVPATQKPEFYLTVTYPASGQNVLQFQVRRTDGGAVTGARTIPAADVGWGGYLAASAGDRTFYFARYPCTTSADPHTTFDRISVTGSGQISGITAAGPEVAGMVTSFAVNPQGTQVAYNALPGTCTGDGFRSTAAASVSVDDLTTGAVRTWTNTAVKNTVVSQLSWTPDGHTVIVDEHPAGLDRADLTVYGLDASSPGGSLQAHSTTLLSQRATCTTCVATALAGPDGRLTELESQPAGQGSRVLVVSVPPSGVGHPITLLSEPSTAPASRSDNAVELFADSSGEWLLLWPAGSSSPPSASFHGAGYVSRGHLHPLPGVARIFPQGIAW